MVERIIVVSSHPLSDIGKGWLAASITSLLPNSAILKVDPLLNSFEITSPTDQLASLKLSTDIPTYALFNLPLIQSQPILLGNLMRSYLDSTWIPKEVLHSYLTDEHFARPDHLTFHHFADFVANQLYSLTNWDAFTTVVIEVGGVTGDLESIPIVEGIKRLAKKLHVPFCPILLSMLEHQEADKSESGVKTRLVTHAIDVFRYQYGEPLAVFVRQHRSQDYSNSAVGVEIKQKMAVRSGVDPSCIIFVPTVDCVFDLRAYLIKMPIPFITELPCNSKEWLALSVKKENEWEIILPQ